MRNVNIIRNLKRIWDARPKANWSLRLTESWSTDARSHYSGSARLHCVSWRYGLTMSGAVSSGQLVEKIQCPFSLMDLDIWRASWLEGADNG